MKRRWGLQLTILLVMLCSLIPSVFADTLNLYVDGFTNRNPASDWTYVGISPYLDDSDANEIYTKIDAAESGNYSFSNLPAGSINDVKLYLEVKADDVNNDHIEIYVWDGTQWNTVTLELQASQTTYYWENLDLDDSGWIDTRTKINACQLYVVYDKVGGADEYYIRRAYLYVDYTPSSGTDYVRDLSQSVSWSGDTYRKDWNAHRDLSQSISWSISVLRGQWNLERDISQTLTFTWDTYVYHFVQYLRTLSLGISWSGNGLRTSWDTKIDLSQSLSFTFNIDRRWTLERTLTQGLTFTWNTFGEILEGYQQYVRDLTLSLNWSSNLARQWFTSRSISQSISFVWNAYDPIDQFEIPNTDPSTYLINAQVALIALIPFLVLATIISDIQKGVFGIDTLWKTVMLVAILGASALLFRGWGY